MDYFRNPKLVGNERSKCHKVSEFVSNLFDCVLYAICTVLGFAAMVAGGFGFMPVVFVVVFTLRTMASGFYMFSQDGYSDKVASKIARLLSVASLGIMGLSLVLGGIAFAPALASTLGLTAVLFVKIASIVMGALFMLAAASRFYMGAELDNTDFHVNNNYFGSMEKVSSEMSSESDKKLKELDKELEEKQK